MSAPINQKAYLQKYLSGPSKEKKKKKKKVVKGKGLRIVDDDIDLSKLRPLEGDEFDVYGEGEDAPQIAGIIDERPDEIKKLEQFKTSSKWKVISQDDGFNSKLQIEEIKKDIVEQQKDNELVFGKMYSDSEDEKEMAKDSPPRKQTSKAQNNSDSDFSPPRKNDQQKLPKSQETSKNYNSDLSPPRKHESHSQKSKERRRKPSRWGDDKEINGSPGESHNRRHVSDESPPRKRKTYDSDPSPPKRSQNSNDSKRDKHNESNSLPHRRQKRKDSNDSPPRKSSKEHRSQSPDSDLSPPRKRATSPESDKHSSRIRHNDRRNNKYTQRKPPDRRDNSVDGSRKSPDSDLSPPRRRQTEKEYKRTNDSDSDLSPPRKDSKYKKNDRMKRNSNSPPPSNKRMAARTLDGKKAGLSDAAQLRHENESFRRREDEAFRNMTDEVSGRNAKAVSRKTKRETSEDRQKLAEKAQRQKELDEKYKKWSKGLKQVEAQEARLAEFVHEASKPLARHRDDRDLDAALKDIDRQGDPMLAYIRDKKRERGELPPEKPQYKGNFPPNRFNIRPGYRWDGVDRSNGYEKKYFEQQSKKRAMQEEAYKWATEDL